MEIQEFNDVVDKVMGVKSGVEWAALTKEMPTGKMTVRLQIVANENQIKKLIPIILNHNI